jgi:mono/diheme cytochrome c family protein
MKPTNLRRLERLALNAGFVAACWLSPSIAMSGVNMPLQVGVPAAGGPDRTYLAQADAAAGEKPVSFASEQADRGEERYVKDCEECHGDDLKGGLNGGAPLRGLSFEQKYFDGLPASLLFSFMSTAMPPQSPGRYSPAVYADLMAYVLKENGVQPGAPLPSDMDALDYLVMEK